MEKVRRLEILIKKKYNIAVGERSAEEILLKIKKDLDKEIEISGRSYETGKKVAIRVPRENLLD